MPLSKHDQTAFEKITTRLWTTQAELSRRFMLAHLRDKHLLSAGIDALTQQATRLQQAMYRHYELDPKTVLKIAHMNQQNGGSIASGVLYSRLTLDGYFVPATYLSRNVHTRNGQLFRCNLVRLLLLNSGTDAEVIRECNKLNDYTTLRSFPDEYAVSAQTTQTASTPRFVEGGQLHRNMQSGDIGYSVRYTALRVMGAPQHMTADNAILHAAERYVRYFYQLACRYRLLVAYAGRAKSLACLESLHKGLAQALFPGATVPKAKRSDAVLIRDIVKPLLRRYCSDIADSPVAFEQTSHRVLRELKTAARMIATGVQFILRQPDDSPLWKLVPSFPNYDRQTGSSRSAIAEDTVDELIKSASVREYIWAALYDTIPSYAPLPWDVPERQDELRERVEALRGTRRYMP